MIHDFSKADDFRKETVAYLRGSVLQHEKWELSNECTNPVITCFGPVGKAISENYNERKSVCSSLIF